MLNRMAEDIDVDPVYVLDMYRHGKVNWMLDLGLRFDVLVVVIVLTTTVQKNWKGEKNAE